MDGKAQFGEPGQAGMAESVGVTQSHHLAFGVGDLHDVAESAQNPVAAARWVDLVAAAVAHALHEQEPPGTTGCVIADPTLLFSNDFGDVTVDEDAVGCDV